MTRQDTAGKNFNYLDALFNVWRFNPISGKTLRAKAASMNLSTGNATYAVKCGILVKKGNAYCFTRKPEASDGELLRVTSSDRRAQPKGAPEPEVSPKLVRVSIEDAITILKREGYKVSKPVTTYEEV